MPYCPKCRYEYKPEIVTCPDCNEKLVAELPIEPEPTEEGKSYDDWVQVARFTSQQYSDMLLEVLRAKNIPAVIQSGAGYFGQTGQMSLSSFLPIGGGFSLMIPRQFLVDADREANLILGDDWEKAKLIEIQKP